MEVVFWLSAILVIYAYVGYPVTLALLSRVVRRPITRGVGDYTPEVSLIIPAYNEEAVITRKLANTLSLDYPPDKLQIIVVSDASTDLTDELVTPFADKSNIELVRVAVRQGKANALNAGLERAQGEHVVFSDSSIMLDSMALREIVRPFADPEVGIVSGEDHIAGGGGEGLYGRYELYLRNKESALHSIVGASGSFYAQRRYLVDAFPEGLAPDFLSVLNTVEKGFRAVSEPTAIGFMTALPDTQEEFRRKVRTLLRGMSTLWAKRSLLNPLKYRWFAFELLCHKILRWLVPAFLVLILVGNLSIAASPFYALTLLLQIAFYALALLAWQNVGNLSGTGVGKVALYFTSVNLAIAYAWLRFVGGVRQELWEPSRRSG
jgi:cellulose synthase/poly-beta-1,6-N-acetylglucosamine synthase-like glycosyltransferase